jgi:hypothetical protein
VPVAAQGTTGGGDVEVDTTTPGVVVPVPGREVVVPETAEVDSAESPTTTSEFGTDTEIVIAVDDDGTVIPG